MSPVRVQRQRTKGWRKPENTVYVGRGSRWGNPFIVGKAQLRFPRVDGTEAWEFEGRLHKRSGERHAFVRCEPQSDGSHKDIVTWHEVRDATREECVALFREAMTGKREMLDWYPRSEAAEIRAALGGRNLMCWCPLDQQCHADVLLELANP